MPKSTSIISLGILVVLLPFISIFRSWKDVLTFILGALIIWTGNRLRKQETNSGMIRTDTAHSQTYGEER